SGTSCGRRRRSADGGRRRARPREARDLGQEERPALLGGGVPAPDARRPEPQAPLAELLRPLRGPEGGAISLLFVQRGRQVGRARRGPPRSRLAGGEGVARGARRRRPSPVPPGAVRPGGSAGPTVPPAERRAD